MKMITSVAVHVSIGRIMARPSPAWTCDELSCDLYIVFSLAIQETDGPGLSKNLKLCKQLFF
jgi:hypothetical protein